MITFNGLNLFDSAQASVADAPFALGNVVSPALPVELDDVAVFPTDLDASTVRGLFHLATGIPTTSIAS